MATKVKPVKAKAVKKFLDQVEKDALTVIKELGDVEVGKVIGKTRQYVYAFRRPKKPKPIPVKTALKVLEYWEKLGRKK